MTTKPVKLVCFDLGGVLVRICRSWAEGCYHAGVDVRHDDHTIRPLLPRWGELVRAHQTGHITCREYFTSVGELVNGLYSPREIELIHNAWILGEYADLHDLIDILHEQAIETAALSNTNASHWKQLKTFDVINRLHHHLPSHRLGLHKPDAAIFHVAEQQVNHRGPEMLFFDDTQENVRAARKVGWRAEHINPFMETAPQIRDSLARHGITLDSR